MAAEVTVAVRDSGSEAGDIATGDHLGLSGGKVRVIAGSLLEAACGFHCGRAGNFVPNPHLRPDIDTARLVGMPTGESTLADVVPSATVRPAVDELWHAEATACVRNAEARRRRGKTGCSGFT